MNDRSPQDFDPENICVQVIVRARILYETNEYPSNYEGQTFASAREDALTFFHSRQFEQMCQLLNLPAWKVREIADVPQPTPVCRCENCRTDYREEARLVQALPRQQRFRFAFAAQVVTACLRRPGIQCAELYKPRDACAFTGSDQRLHQFHMDAMKAPAVAA